MSSDDMSDFEGSDAEFDQEQLRQWSRAQIIDEDEHKEALPVKTLTGKVVYTKDDEELNVPVELIRVKGIKMMEDKKVAPEPQKKGKRSRDEQEEDEEGEEGMGEEDEDAEKEEEDEEPSAKKPKKSAPSDPFSLDKFGFNKELRREKILEEIAVACGKLLESPEDNFGELKGLLAFADDADGQVARLAQLSLARVFCQICPGYKIRPMGEEEAGGKPLSKEVARLRNFEGGLLANYQAFLKLLVSRVRGKDQDAGVKVAAQSMCVLLSSLSHFNYRSDLLANVVRLAASRHPDVRTLATDSLRRVLARDTDFEVTVETTQLLGDLVRQCFKPLSKMQQQLYEMQRAVNPDSQQIGKMKALQQRLRKALHHSVPPEVLEVLSAVQFTDLAPQEEEEEGQGKGKKGKKGQTAAKGPKRGWDKKADKELERDLAEGEAVTSRDVLQRRQSRALEHVMEAYFRVLKGCVALVPKPAPVAPGAAAEVKVEEPAAPGCTEERDRAASSSTLPSSSLPSWVLRLVTPTLRGLASVGEHIGTEYFTDLTTLLTRLVKLPGVNVLDQAQTLLTLSEMLQRQLEAFRVDRETLFEGLDHTTARAPLEPLQDREDEDEEAGPSEPPSRYVNQLGPAFARLLNAFFSNTKAADLSRLATMLKAATTASLHGQPVLSMGVLGNTYLSLKRYSLLRSMLEGEGVEGGGPPTTNKLYDPRRCTRNSALWELSVLQRHVHPHISSQASHIAHLAVNQGVQNPIGAALPYPVLGPEELAKQFLPIGSEGTFRPAPKFKPRSDKAARKNAEKGTGPAPLSKAVRSALQADVEGGEEELEDIGKRFRRSFRELRKFGF